MQHIPTFTFGDTRLPERIWAKVVIDTGSGCWVWMGTRNQSGYGMAYTAGRHPLLHRHAYEALTGDAIPEGLTIDHVALRGCIHRACLNPAHLEVVTKSENSRRAWAARPRLPKSAYVGFDETFVIDGVALTRRPFKTHCPRGHEYTPENTYLTAHKTGPVGRECKICKKHRAKHGYYPDPVTV